MLNKCIFDCLDHILVFSKNLKDVSLSRSPSFATASVIFLGFIIAMGQLNTYPAKIQVVTEWPTRSSCKQLQCYLSFVISTVGL